MDTKSALLGFAGIAIQNFGRRSVNSYFRNRAPIIFYHGVWPRGAPQNAFFSGSETDRFRDNLRQLSQAFRFVELDDLLRLNACGALPHEPVMALNFDDGLDLIRTGVLEILEECGIRATVFVVVESVGNRRLMWMHALAAIRHGRGTDRFISAYNATVCRRRLGSEINDVNELPYSCLGWPMNEKDQIVEEIWQCADMPTMDEFMQQHRPYMDWDDLRTWITQGHSVGLHTRTHPFCSRLCAFEIEYEIADAAAELRAKLDLDSIAFAYPFGDRLVSAATEEDIAQRAGLSCMLGIRGVSRLGTPSWRLERMVAENGLSREVYGRPIVRSLMRRA